MMPATDQLPRSVTSPRREIERPCLPSAYASPGRRTGAVSSITRSMMKSLYPRRHRLGPHRTGARLIRARRMGCGDRDRRARRRRSASARQQPRREERCRRSRRSGRLDRSLRREEFIVAAERSPGKLAPQALRQLRTTASRRQCRTQHSSVDESGGRRGSPNPATDAFAGGVDLPPPAFMTKPTSSVGTHPYGPFSG
jgi:hypothetical protein